MTPTEVIYIILFSLPAYTALICGLYLCRMLYLKENPFERKPFIMTIVSYFTSMLLWFSQILYYVLPEFYVPLNALIFLIFTLVYVFSYRFVFEMTKINPAEEFTYFHYLIPALVFAVITVWSYGAPREVQLTLVRSGGVAVEGFNLFSLFFESKIPLLLCMNLAYSLLGLRRLARYRKVVVNYSSDEFRGSFTWLYQFVFSMLAMFVTLTIMYIVSLSRQFNQWWLLTLSAFAIAKYVILTHNILLENFVVIDTDLSDTGHADPVQNTGFQSLKDAPSRLNEQIINKLEAYLQRQKPFLNPKLKITDLTRELHTNRTSLSQLINSTYNVNFCRFINRFRLQELDRLKSIAANKSLSEEELANKAGFSDYRGYLRAKYREEVNISV